MANFNLRDDFVLQKGPLSDQEQLLKDFLLRDTLFRTPGFSVGDFIGPAVAGASGSLSTKPTNPTTPPIIAQPSGGDITITQLGLVHPGDLITADFMNGLVRTVNELVAYLRHQSTASATAPVNTPGSDTGIAGQLKDVVIGPADEGNKVTVTFPAGTAEHNDFADILIGNTRVDPGDLVKLEDGRFSFQVDKNVFTAGTGVRAVSKAGSSAQQIMRLFK